MFIYHKIFVITYSLQLTVGEWHAHDDFEASGLDPERTTRIVTYVAPSEAVARAHFMEKNSGLLARNNMTLDSIETQTLDAVIANMDLR